MIENVEISSPDSNALSNSFAFIDTYLRLPRPTNRNDANLVVAVGNHGGPTAVTDHANHQEPCRFFVGRQNRKTSISEISYLT